MPAVWAAWPDDVPMSSDCGKSNLEPGLYIVATPIGAARDITLRSLDILKEADILAAEDTRRIRHLLSIHGIPVKGRKLVRYDDRSGAGQRKRLLSAVSGGARVALTSDAGTPLVADPGFRLVQEFRLADLNVFHAPGPSAVLAALAVSGQPTDRFLFAGFMPARPAARRAFLRKISDIRATVVLFEAPARLGAALADLAAEFSGNRPASICRELTKVHEEVLTGSLYELGDLITGRLSVESGSIRGEVVIVVGPPGDDRVTSDAEIDRFLLMVLDKLSPRDASVLAARCLDVPRKRAYARAVVLKPKPL